MKKAGVAGIMLALLCSSVVFAAEPIQVVIDGTPVVFDQQPMVIDDRTMVPLRGIFEAMGAKVDWEQESKTIIAQKNEDVIMLRVGSKLLYRNDEAISLDVSPVIRGDRVLIPARAVAEAFGAEVLWKAEERKVVVNTNSNPIDAIKLEQYTVNTRTVAIEEKDEDGNILMKIEYAYPEINNSTGDASVNKLNEIILQEVRDEAGQFQKKYLDLAKNDKKKQGGKFVPYESRRKFDVTYSKNGILSIVGTITNQLNVDTTEVFRDAGVYDMKIVRKLKVSDLVTDSKTNLEQAVKQSFLTMIQNHPKEFFSDSEKKVENNLENVDFYLVDRGIVFYFNPGVIAPEENGIVGFLAEVDWNL